MARGPSYPYLGLEEAIGTARKVYDFAKRAPAPTESVITEAWKYSLSSSGAQKTLAALRAFGLLEDAPGTNGRAIKLTARAIRILLDEDDSPERKEEIRKAALSPKWYDYCWRTWGKEMPPSMRSNLLIEHSFVESTIDSFLKDYRRTIAFAGLMDEALLSKNDDSKEESGNSFRPGDYVQWESQGILKMPAAKKLTHYEDSPRGRYAFVEGDRTGIPANELIAAEPSEDDEQVKPQHTFIPVLNPAKQGAAKMQTETFALPEGVTGQLQWPVTMSADAFEDFVYQLEGLKRRVGRAVRRDTPPEADVTSNSEG